MTTLAALRASLPPRTLVARRGGVCRACLDASAALMSLQPTLSTNQEVSGTVVVTTGSEPLSRNGALPLPRLKVAHR